MSYHVYTIDGYGICDADNACEVTKERIEKLLALAPKVSKRFHEEFGTDYEIEDVDDYEADYSYIHGIFALLGDVMNEAEYSDSLYGVGFVMCDDFDCRQYIMYEPTYPWRMTDREKRMTFPISAQSSGNIPRFCSANRLWLISTLVKTEVNHGRASECERR